MVNFNQLCIGGGKHECTFLMNRLGTLNIENKTNCTVPTTYTIFIVKSIVKYDFLIIKL